MIAHLIRALQATGTEPDWRDVADALWLALDPDFGAAAGSSLHPPEGEGPELAAPTPAADVPTERATTRSAARIARTDEEREAGVAPAGEHVVGLEMAAPRSGALLHRLQLARALGPFKQRRRSPVAVAFNPEATIDRLCETGTLVPVMSPVHTRWFDELAIVVDATPTMVVWSDVVDELIALVEQHGAFGRVTVWRLSGTREQVHVQGTGGLLQDPSALLDASARRLTLVVTDGVDDRWRGASVWEALRAWGRYTPTAIVQMLPPRLWEATALGGASVVLSADRRGEPSSRLRLEAAWWWIAEGEAQDAIPIITLDDADVGRWARLVMGDAEVGVRGVLTHRPDTTDPVVASPSAERSARERVETFRATVSEPALRLATLLSAVEITLPVARLILSELVEDGRLTHLAEVLAGGLFEPPAGDDPASATYRFHGGVRDILQEALSADATLDVWRVVAPYLEAATGAAPFSVLLGLAAPGPDDTASSEMATIAATLIKRLGLGAIAEDAAVVETADGGGPPSFDDMSSKEFEQHGRQLVAEVGSPRDHAVVIGKSYYRSLPPLPHAEADALRFRDWLLDPRGGGLQENQVHVLTPESEDTPLATAALSALRMTVSSADEATAGARRLYLAAIGHGTGRAEMVLSETDEPWSIVPIGAIAEQIAAAGVFEEIVLLTDLQGEPRRGLSATFSDVLPQRLHKHAPGALLHFDAAPHASPGRMRLVEAFVSALAMGPVSTRELVRQLESLGAIRNVFGASPKTERWQFGQPETNAGLRDPGQPRPKLDPPLDPDPDPHDVAEQEAANGRYDKAIEEALVNGVWDAADLGIGRELALGQRVTSWDLDELELLGADRDRDGALQVLAQVEATVDVESVLTSAEYATLTGSEDGVELTPIEAASASGTVRVSCRVTVRLVALIRSVEAGTDVQATISAMAPAPIELARRATRGRGLEPLVDQLCSEMVGMTVVGYLADEPIESEIQGVRVLQTYGADASCRIREVLSASDGALLCALDATVQADVEWIVSAPSPFDAEHFSAYVENEESGAPILRKVEELAPLTADLTATWSAKSGWSGVGIVSVALTSEEVEVRRGRATAAELGAGQLDDEIEKPSAGSAQTEQDYRDALDIAQRLATADPTNPQLQRDLSISYDNLAELARDRGDNAQAEQLYRDALNIAQRLATADPTNPRLQRDLSISYDNLAGLARDRGDNAQAEQLYRDALNIRTQLATADPTNPQLQRDLSFSYNNLAGLARDRGDSAQAEQLYRDALNIAQRLATADPTNPELQRDLSISYNNLAGLARDRGDSAQAEQLYRDALNIAQRLATADPTNPRLQRDLSISYNNLARLARDRGDNAQAEQLYRDALNIRTQLATADPTNPQLQRDLSISYDNVARLARDGGDSAQAEQLYRDALNICTQLATADPTNPELQRDLSISYNNVAGLARDHGDNAQAEQLYRDALNIAQRLATADPTNPQLQRDLSISYNNLARLARDHGDNAQAEQLYRDALNIAQRLATADPTNPQLQRDLSISYDNLAELARERGDNAQAEQLYRDALNIAQRLATADPTNPELQRDLSISYDNLARLARDRGDNAQADIYAKESARAAERGRIDS